MKILIPILSRHENDELFLETALSEASEVILLVTIDGSALVGKFGFVASELSAGSKIMESLAKQLRARKMKVDECVEWGDTTTKISQLAQVKKADKIVLQNQQNQYFERLVLTLEKELSKKVRVQII